MLRAGTTTLPPINVRVPAFMANGRLLMLSGVPLTQLTQAVLLKGKSVL